MDLLMGLLNQRSWTRSWRKWLNKALLINQRSVAVSYYQFYNSGWSPIKKGRGTANFENLWWTSLPSYLYLVAFRTSQIVFNLAQCVILIEQVIPLAFIYFCGRCRGLGSCLLLASTVEFWSTDTLGQSFNQHFISTSVDSWSTPHWHLSGQSVESLLIFDWCMSQSTLSQVSTVDQALIPGDVNWVQIEMLIEGINWEYRSTLDCSHR